MENTGGSRLLQMQARFQQRQMAEKEQKMVALYEAQQARALGRVRASARVPTPAPAPIGSTGQPGKVRQMFEERRTKAGIDKSYPLQPIQNNNGDKPAPRKQLPNGYVKVTHSKTKAATERKTVTKIVTNSNYVNGVNRKLDNIVNGSGDLNHNTEADLDQVKSVTTNGSWEQGTDETDTANGPDGNYQLDDETFPEGLAPTSPPPSAPPRSQKSPTSPASHKSHTPTTSDKSRASPTPEKSRASPASEKSRASPTSDKSRASPISEKAYTPQATHSLQRRSPGVRSSPSKTPPRAPPAPPAPRRAASDTVANKPPTRQPAAGAMIRSANPAQARNSKSRVVASGSGPADSGAASAAASAAGRAADSVAGETCGVCGRRFAAERLARHEEICRRAQTKRRKPYDALKHRLAGTGAEPFIRQLRKTGKSSPAATKPTTAKPVNSSWRQKHEDFIRAIRAAKQAQAYVAAGGKLSDLPPPPPSENPDYVACPHCGRRFNRAAAERHVPKCQNFQFNKPRPQPAKRR